MGEIKAEPEGQKLLQMLVLFCFIFIFLQGLGGGAVWDIGGPRKKSLTKWRWCGPEGDGD